VRGERRKGELGSAVETIREHQRRLGVLWHTQELGRSALDPVATTKIEELVQQLKVVLIIVIATHNVQQAARTTPIEVAPWR
jgi:hypothetical protein